MNSSISSPFLISSCPPWSLRESPGYRIFSDIDITVIITLYNYAEYISACLDSVVASTFDDLSLAIEIIIIDDASTDSSREVVRSWMSDHEEQRVLLVQKEFNTGLPDARNIGIRMSRGDAIFILDADNSIDVKCLSTLYARLSDSSASAIYSIITKYSSRSGQILGYASHRSFDINALIRSNYIDAMAMFKKSALFEAGLYDVNMVYGWEDYDLWLSLGFAGHEILALAEPLANYRVHDNSMLQRLNQKVVGVARYLFEKHALALQSYELPDVVFGCPKSTLMQCG